MAEAMTILKHGLSTTAISSTVVPESTRGQENFRVIGLGSCGTVFEVPGTELAYKKGTDTASIWQDFCLTNRVYNAINDVRPLLQTLFPEQTIPKTPRCYEFNLPNDDAFWSVNLERFPTDHRSKKALFSVDKIHPLPRNVREALIETYFDEDERVQQQSKEDPDNVDCLVRIYMGERETAAQEFDAYDSLRNFPLRLNMMEDIGLDVSNLATEVAIGLAILHWQAQVDAMDTEFVLGSFSAMQENRLSRAYDNVMALPQKVLNLDSGRAAHLWMLDFDKATPIQLTEYDVDKRLVPAFLGNDPYYPRPQAGSLLWQEFCSAYQKAGEAILATRRVGPTAMFLPQRFLDGVLRVSEINDTWNQEEEILFAD